jgi:hypothetical protein
MTTVYIGTCTTCGATHRIEGTAPRFVTCVTCRTDPAWQVAHDTWMAEHPNGYYPAPSIAMARISGRVGKKVCDEACRSAKANQCCCTCGGRNHGAQYA